MTGLAGFRERYRGGILPLLIALALYVFVPSQVFHHVWLDVRSVTFEPDLSGEVDRVIHRDFAGTFDVELRRVHGDRFICSGNPSPRIINYRVRSGTINPASFSLREWMALDQPWEPQTCVDRGFVAGEAFYVRTCHYSLLPNGWTIGRRCVKSNDFEPDDAGIASFLKT